MPPPSVLDASSYPTGPGSLRGLRPDAAIASGDKITWINEDEEPHTVTAYDGSFDSGVLNPGDTYTVTFLGEGTVEYYCTIHPRMVGSVTVE